MSDVKNVALGELMATKLGAVNPSAFPDEVFDLYSIPAFDSRTPDAARGTSIGSSKQVVRPGDVLLSKIVPHIRRAWVVGADKGRRVIASGEWIVFRSERVFPAYLRHVLLGDTFHKQFMQTVAGVGGSLLRARPSQVANILVPLPHIPEQRRIAAILDQADFLRARRREAMKQLDGLAQSVFREMFASALDSSERMPLSSHVQEFRYGTSNKSGPTGLPALRIPNVNGGSLDLNELKTVVVDDAEFERLRLRDGDVLFVRTNGNQDYVGRCAVFREASVAATEFSATSFIYASYLIRARLRAESLLPEVLQAYLTSEEGRIDLLSRSKTSAGQFNINTEGLGALRIPNFSMPLQADYVKKLRIVEDQRTAQRAHLTELDRMFASLQHRAFSGGL